MLRGATKRIPALLILALGGISPAPAQEDPVAAELKALRQEVEALKLGQRAMQSQLEEIRTLLRAGARAQQPPAEVVLDLDGEPVQGEAEAPLILAEFSDYQ